MLGADTFYQDVRGSLALLYPNAYFSSWSGAEFHNLTASSSRDYVLFSADFEKDESTRHYNQLVSLKKIPTDCRIGIVRVDSENGGFFVADVHRTLVDMLYDTDLAGGDEIINEAFDSYFELPQADLKTLISYARQCQMPQVVELLTEKGKTYDIA